MLLVDDERRVLLQHCCDPASRQAGNWWNTLGGGLDDGESFVQAAARELHEETGLVVNPSALGEVVHRRLTEFSFGGVDYRQAEEYFLLRTERFDAAPTGHSELEMMAVLGTRWWDRDALRATSERVYPAELAELLDRLAP
ncbi:MAG: NUDIX domain-containing protein [Frankiales bacterium]|nr:NUDIX domain-containing protein [Frankiales bacterium]